jgi:ribonucleoside-diphosphate reductase alpha chain
MLMRVAVGIHKNDLDAAIETYNSLSEGWYTHATPTLFNAGSPKPQMSSCFLLQLKDDSINGIYDTLKQCAQISQSAGGIGLSIHNLRAKGSYIKGTNGTSNGIVPMLRVFNDTARYVDQGGGKRKGSFAIYLEPWHADVEDFLELKKNHGKEEMRARDLFYAMWIPDLFMKRVEQNGDWTLMCPNECPGLGDNWGEKFEALYEKYESEGKGRKTMKAQDLWFKILESQIETGTPYILFKDAPTQEQPAEPRHHQEQQPLHRDHRVHRARRSGRVQPRLHRPAEVRGEGQVRPPEAVRDHRGADEEPQPRDRPELLPRARGAPQQHAPPPHRHRRAGPRGRLHPHALSLRERGGQGAEPRDLRDHLLRRPHRQQGTREGGRPYETYPGSPASKGILQFDMWGPGVKPSDRWEWDILRDEIKQHGIRNSLLVAPMPTASTAQILGNNECFEPYTSNLYTRRVLSGEFIVVNKYLLRDLVKLGLWSDEMKNKIIQGNGSVQHIPEIPQNLKELYKTAWEISQKTIIDMSADRGAYICQSQSLNVFMENVNFAKLTSMHFHSWKAGLKTGMYYLRTKAATDAIKFTLDKSKLAQPAVNAGEKSEKVRETAPVTTAESVAAAQAVSVTMSSEAQAQISCSLDDPEGCEMCGA